MNLALKYRPKTIDELLGQKFTQKNGAVRTFVEQKRLPHMFFWGVPGSGKTSLARILAGLFDYTFYEKNATSFKIEDLREIFKSHKNTLAKPLIFIDEVHRLNKSQQEVLLPFMEEQRGLIIGASTQNPFFSLTGAIRSRSFLFEFEPISSTDLEVLLKRVAKLENISLDEKTAQFLVQTSSGDARAMLNHLEFCVKNGTADLGLARAIRSKTTEGVSESESHYNLASAFIKSIRGSDENAAIYYLARLLNAGEDPAFIARRLVIFASEDIGNANPNALNLASSCLNAVANIGMPEARIILSQTAIYLSLCPKSNSAYKAIDKALDFTSKTKPAAIPQHLKDAHYAGAKELGIKGYLYPHDFGGWVAQEYMPIKASFVELKIGFEETLKTWKSHTKNIKQ